MRDFLAASSGYGPHTGGINLQAPDGRPVVWQTTIGRHAFECLRLLRSRPPVVLDDRFGSDLRQIIADEPIDHRHPWDC